MDTKNSRLVVADIEIDLRTRRASRGREDLHLEPKAFDVLCYLIENRARVVGKDELLERFWPETFVGDNALSRVIAQIRRVLGDDSREPRFLETIPRVGYRFICRLQEPPADFPLAPLPAGKRGFAWMLVVGLLISGLLVAGYRARVESDTTAAGAFSAPVSSQQITSSLGLDFGASFSPDGNSIAYSSDRSGSFEIYLRQLAPGGREIQLTSDGMQNFQPAWSPDGANIAYYSRLGGGIWLIPALGGRSHQLSDFGSYPSWSPDGSRLVFQSDPLLDLGPIAANHRPGTELWTVDLRTSNRRILTRGCGAPTWSPTSPWIACTSREKQARLWLVSSETGEKRMALEQQLLRDAFFAPSGRRLLFLGTDRNGKPELQWLALDSEGFPAGEAYPLGFPTLRIPRFPAISPDGRLVVFSSLDLTSNLHLLEFDQSGRPRPPLAITQDRELRNGQPIFSPDSKQIVHTVWRAGEKTTIWLRSAHGEDAGQVSAPGPVSKFAPDWMPDGRTLLFTSIEEQVARFWKLDLISGREYLLAQFGGPVSTPSLSADARRILFASPQAEVFNLWTIDLETQKNQQITYEKESIGWGKFSPDGQWIVAEAQEGEETHVVILPAAGGEIRQLTDRPGQSWVGDWSPDGSRIVFAALRNGFWNLYSIPSEGGEETRLSDYEKLNSQVRAPDWSPDGQMIVYEYSETSGNLWALRLP